MNPKLPLSIVHIRDRVGAGASQVPGYMKEYFLSLYENQAIDTLLGELVPNFPDNLCFWNQGA